VSEYKIFEFVNHKKQSTLKKKKTTEIAKIIYRVLLWYSINIHSCILAFQVSPRDTSNYLYYKLDRKLQSSAEKGNKIKNDISNRRCLIQDVVSGNDGHHEKVGRKTMELGSDTGAAVYIL